jgi:hypothetical protein
MTWDELKMLFEDTLADILPAPTIATVLDLVAGLDAKSSPRDITVAFVAPAEKWERDS